MERQKFIELNQNSNDEYLLILLPVKCTKWNQTEQTYRI